MANGLGCGLSLGRLLLQLIQRVTAPMVGGQARAAVGGQVGVNRPRSEPVVILGFWSEICAPIGSSKIPSCS